MATDQLNGENENIYNVESEAQNPQSSQGLQGESENDELVQQQSNKKMYISQFRGMVKEETQRRKMPHRTMGHARTPLSSPCKYLKKNEGIRFRNSSDHKCFKKEVPPVPRHDETLETAGRNPSGNHDGKQLDLTTKRPRPRYADTVKGTLHDLFTSGLMPQYVFRPTFGKVPDYIVQRKQLLQAESERLQREAEQIQREAEEEELKYTGRGKPKPAAKSDVKYIGQEERLKLLTGLKANWEKLQKRYQGLPVLTDTEAKKTTKINMEKELRQLEQDIMLLENNPYIYICNNSNQH